MSDKSYKGLIGMDFLGIYANFIRKKIIYFVLNFFI